MYSLVNVESRFLCEAFHTNIAFEWPLASVGARVDLQVGLAGERGRTLHALVGPSLDFTPTH